MGVSGEVYGKMIGDMSKAANEVAVALVLVLGLMFAAGVGVGWLLWG